MIKTRFDTEKLKEAEVRTSFQIQVHNRFEALNLGEEETPDVDDRLEKIEAVLVEAAEETLGFARPRRGEDWYDGDCRLASQDCKKAKERWEKERDDDSRDTLREKRRIAKRLFKMKNKEKLENELNEI